MKNELSNIKKGMSRNGRFGIWLSCYIPRVLVFTCILFAPVLERPVYAAVFNIASSDVAGLINAINTANSNGQENTINMAAGTYTLVAVDNNTDGPNGLPSITSNITINGAGANTTIIERASTSTPPFRIIHVAATGTLTLDKLTIRGGVAAVTGEPFEEETGGGILNQGGTLNINDSNITDNLTAFGSPGGGGISNLNGGTVTITNSTISGNRADSSSCGGIINEGQMTITKSIIDGNIGEVVGGICNDSEMTVNNSSISGNFGERDAGIMNAGDMTIINSTISNNNSLAVGPGGIDNGGNLTIINSTIANNGCTCVGRIDGGGISNGGVANIINTTIVNNNAEAMGVGGIFNRTEATVELQNAMVALNTEGLNGKLKSDCGGQITSLGNNIIGDSTGCTITLQSSDLTGDPGLDSFIDNGTPGNGHFPLLSRSQAINAGNNAVCLAKPILATDQIGDPRVGICDIGSIEFEPFKNLGQCISTLFQQNCSGLTGNSRADCNKQQPTFCFNLFNGK